MREWLKDHGLDLASLVVAVVGVKGLTDFWARLQEMFSSYSTEALFSCGLAAAAAAIVATYFARSGYRRRIAAKDAEIAEAIERATKPLQEQVDCIMNRENYALMRLRGLSLKELGIIKEFMTQSGEVMLKVDDASVRKLVDSGAIRINSDTYSPPDLFPFTLDDSLRSLLVEFPETLDKAVEEAESVKSRYSGADAAGRSAGSQPTEAGERVIA